MNEQRAALELTKLINGFQVSQIIHVAASLGIADILKDGSRSGAEIAAETGTHPRSMYRLMHALASAGVLKERDDNRFSLTALGTCLRSDSPHSRVAWAKKIGRPYAWQAWGELLESVRTGEDAFRRKHGRSVWDWRSEQPEETAIFDAAMTELSRDASEMIARAVDFSGFGCIVDVGGGHGVFLAEVLAQNPRSTGILYDLPHVVPGASAVLAQHDVTPIFDSALPQIFERTR
jgi:O-methyltransferase domain/Dimerisation domain